MNNLTEKVKAIRVTFVVDEGTNNFLSKGHAFSQSDELWIWESSEDIDYEVFIPCEECDSRAAMEEYACTNNQGYCSDCCECDEHFPANAIDTNE